MKKLLLLLLAIIGLSSCSNEDNQKDYNTNGIGKKTMNAKPTKSIGELHNEGLEKMYFYLSEQKNLDSTNINNYSVSFLEDEYGNESAEYYMKGFDSYNFTKDMPIEFIKETENLYSELDTKDFSDTSEFKLFVKNYKPLYISDLEQLEVWVYSTDVLVHSFEYWLNNSVKWERLNSIKALSDNEKPCQNGGWWKKAWCNVKKHVGADFGAAGTYLMIGIISGNPIGIGAGAAASLGASAGSFIKDLF